MAQAGFSPAFVFLVASCIMSPAHIWEMEFPFFNFLRRPQQVKQSLTKTRQSFLTKLTSLVAKNELNEDFWTGLEETLIAADVGVDTTMEMVDALRQQADKERVHE